MRELLPLVLGSRCGPTRLLPASLTLCPLTALRQAAAPGQPTAEYPLPAAPSPLLLRPSTCCSLHRPPGQRPPLSGGGQAPPCVNVHRLITGGGGGGGAPMLHGGKQGRVRSCPKSGRRHCAPGCWSHVLRRRRRAFRLLGRTSVRRHTQPQAGLSARTQVTSEGRCAGGGGCAHRATGAPLGVAASVGGGCRRRGRRRRRRVKRLQEVERPRQLLASTPPVPPLFNRHQLNHLVWLKGDGSEEGEAATRLGGCRGHGVVGAAGSTTSHFAISPTTEEIGR